MITWLWDLWDCICHLQLARLGQARLHTVLKWSTFAKLPSKFQWDRIPTDPGPSKLRDNARQSYDRYSGLGIRSVGPTVGPISWKVAMPLDSVLYFWHDVKMTKDHYGDYMRWFTFPCFLFPSCTIQSGQTWKKWKAGQVKKRMIVSNLPASYQLTRPHIWTSPQHNICCCFCWCLQFWSLFLGGKPYVFFLLSLDRRSIR